MIKWFERYNKISWIITILIAAFIFYISSLSLTGEGKGGWYWQPVAYHLTIFFLLSFFLLISITKGKYRKLILIAVLIAIIYAIIDEIHQSFTPHRDASIFDVMTDTIGILISLVFYSLILHFRKK